MGIKIDVRPEVDKTIYGRLDEAGMVLSTGQNVAITEIEKDDVYINHEPLTPSGTTVIFQDRLVKDYNALENLPTINNIVLKENLTTEDLGIRDIVNYNDMENLPTINNIKIKGNLATEDLGIRDIVDYNEMDNLPSINNVKLVGNLTTEDLGIKTEVEDTQTYIEVNLNFNPNTASVSIMNWVTSNPYGVADEANQQGRPVIAKGYLYYDGNFLETVYLNQTLYSDSAAWGRFKYFLGFTDDETFAYLRINKSGTAICGVKKFI